MFKYSYFNIFLYTYKNQLFCEQQTLIAHNFWAQSGVGQ